MSRNQNTGLYTLPARKPVNGQTIEAEDVNEPLTDIANALNQPTPVRYGGTGAVSADAARTALGLAIGTDVQRHSDVLTTLSGFQPSQNKIPIATGSDTMGYAYLNNRNDLGGSNPDTSGVATEASVKAYADGRHDAALSAAKTYANSRTPAAGSALGLAKSSDDIAFSNGQGTIKNNRVGYDELNAGTGTAGQALVRTAGGIGFATPKRWTRAAPINAAATMQWTGLPAGIQEVLLVGDFSRSADGGSQIRSLAVQLGPDGDADGFVAYHGRQDGGSVAFPPWGGHLFRRQWGNRWLVAEAPALDRSGAPGVSAGGAGAGVGGAGVGNVGSGRIIDGELSSVRITWWGWNGQDWAKNRHWGSTFSGQAHLLYI